MHATARSGENRMNINTLLEKLIDLAQKPKTDFALSMHMTPSGLSKILSGRIRPLLNEKQPFSRQAAAYFAEAIYCPKCYLKFAGIFPILYDFDSRDELEFFLFSAFEYLLDKELAAETNDNSDYSDKGSTFLGNKTILNLFCIITSDYMVSSRKSSLEFYSTLQLFNPLYSHIFRRIMMPGMKQFKSVSFDQFVEGSSLKSLLDQFGMDIFSYLLKAQEYVDLNLWEAPKDMEQSFLLLKGQFLLIFSIPIDGTPLMTLIRHKHYLTLFLNFLFKKGRKKISYSKEEGTAFLAAHPAFIAGLIEQRINIVYNFISIGYLLKNKELKAEENGTITGKALSKLFQSILTNKKTTFVVSVDAMMDFYASGKAVVPLVGAIDIALDNRIPYLRRFESYINERSSDKYKIIFNGELPRIAVLCSRRLSLLYTIDSTYTRERIYVFETDRIAGILYRATVQHNGKLSDFSPELWGAYLDELSNGNGNLHIK